MPPGTGAKHAYPYRDSTAAANRSTADDHANPCHESANPSNAHSNPYPHPNGDSDSNGGGIGYSSTADSHARHPTAASDQEHHLRLSR